MKKIFLLEPYEGIFHETIENKSILKKFVVLDDVEREAAAFENNGGQIVVTRGGSAEKLKKVLKIPVVEIKVTTADILRTFEKFKGSKKTIGVVGYKNVIEKSRWIAECLGLNIKMLEIDAFTKQEKIFSEINNLLHIYGISDFIGDTVLLNMLEEYKLPINFELIKSNKESIDDAITKAEELLKVSEFEKERNKTLTILLNHIDMGVIYADSKGETIHFNKLAEEYFPERTFPSDLAIKKNEPEINRILKVKEKEILLNRIPILIDDELKGTLVTFSESENIKKAEKAIRNEALKRGLLAKHNFNDFISKNKDIGNLKRIAKNYSKTDATVLLTGASGTGKEILAQSIHNSSSRSLGPFVAINCAAIPSQLLESELFGYEAGAFTGASKTGKIGMFELAHRGTIFLDEIGELPLELQTKFLRVIQEGEFRRIGSEEVKKTDFRIIAATNVNLLELVAEKKFRADLYYRLNVLRIETKPLKERKEDIPYLIEHFLSKVGKKYGKYLDGFEDELIRFLTGYDWPGNVRELENIVHRIAVLSSSTKARLEEVIPFLSDLDIEKSSFENNSFFKGSLESIKQKAVRRVLEEEKNNKSKAARRLEIDRGTLERILKN